MIWKKKKTLSPFPPAWPSLLLPAGLASRWPFFSSPSRTGLPPLSQRRPISLGPLPAPAASSPSAQLASPYAPKSVFAPYVGFGVLMTSKLGTNVILMRYVAAISPMKESKS